MQGNGVSACLSAGVRCFYNSSRSAWVVGGASAMMVYACQATPVFLSLNTMQLAVSAAGSQ
jgi:hypothetical protein